MSRTRMDVAELIDRAPVSPLQRRAVGICLLVAVMDGLDAQLMGYAAPAIAKEFGIGAAAFGAVFSAGLLGMAVGSVVLGMLADRIGRRNVMIVSTLLFGLVTLSIPLVAESVPVFVALRFVAGLGLGGVTPSLVAIISEYTPTRTRSLAIMIAVGSLSLGAFLGGIVSTFMIPASGWRSVFVLGGIVPLLLVVAIYLGLPDSLRFLVARGRREEARRVLARIDPAAAADLTDETELADAGSGRASFTELFTRGRALGTVVLWIVFFANLLVMYSLLNWLPLLFGQAGVSAAVATVATSLFALGGFAGGLVLGLVIDRTGRPHRALVIAFLVAIVGVIGITASTTLVPLLLVSVVLAGVGVVGGQTGISVLASAMYPTRTRAAGVGWAYGVGRLGSIVGPGVSGLLLAAGLGPTAIVALAAAPTALATCGIGVLARYGNRPDPDSDGLPATGDPSAVDPAVIRETG